jgi:hypothetical protein
MICALLLLAFSFYNNAIQATDQESVWPIIFWIILLLLIVFNNLLNHHLLRYLDGDLLPRWQSRLHRTITVFYTIGTAFMLLTVISIFVYSNYKNNYRTILLSAMITFSFVILSFIILPFQYKIKRVIRKNFEQQVTNSIQQIGATHEIDQEKM